MIRCASLLQILWKDTGYGLVGLIYSAGSLAPLPFLEAIYDVYRFLLDDDDDLPHADDGPPKQLHEQGLNAGGTVAGPARRAFG